MSKTSSSRLTASAKKQRRQSVDRVECLDGLRDCLGTIGTLADLLEAAGRHPHAELLEPGMVSHTGKLILAEVAKAHEWLDKLEEPTR
jgi:hypothetical protein